MKSFTKRSIEDSLPTLAVIAFLAFIAILWIYIGSKSREFLDFALPKFLELEPAADQHVMSYAIGIIIGVVFFAAIMYYNSYSFRNNLRWLFWLLIIAGIAIVAIPVTLFIVSYIRLETSAAAVQLCWISVTVMAGLATDLLVVLVAAIIFIIIFAIMLFTDKYFLGPGDL